MNYTSSVLKMFNKFVDAISVSNLLIKSAILMYRLSKLKKYFCVILPTFLLFAFCPPFSCTFVCPICTSYFHLLTFKYAFSLSGYEKSIKIHTLRIKQSWSTQGRYVWLRSKFCQPQGIFLQSWSLWPKNILIMNLNI